MNTHERRQLFQRYLNGDADEHTAQRINQILLDDERARKEFLEEASLEEGFRTLLVTPQGSAAATPFRWRPRTILAAAAAVVLLLCSALLLKLLNPAPELAGETPPAPPLARNEAPAAPANRDAPEPNDAPQPPDVEVPPDPPQPEKPPLFPIELARNARILRDSEPGAVAAADSNSGLGFGDTLVVAKGGEAHLRLPDQSIVRCFGGTTLRMPKTDFGWVVEHQSGQIFVEAKPQPNDRRLIVRTPDTEIRIRGTQFLVTITRGGTRVNVETGTVQCSTNAEREFKVLKQGETCIVRKGIVFFSGDGTSTCTLRSMRTSLKPKTDNAPPAPEYTPPEQRDAPPKPPEEREP